jgi:hypothetical protein
MNNPREAISVALFNLLKGITFGSPPTPFQLAARAGRMWDAIPSGSQPAMFLFQVGETATQRTNIALYKWEMEFWCLIYLQADAAARDTTDVTEETQMNAIMDALEKALQPIPGEKQTLGGLVNNVWIEGQVIFDTGIIDQQCAIIIPLKVQTGS